MAEHGAFANPFRSLATGPTAVNPPLYSFLLAMVVKVTQRETLLYGVTVLGGILANALTTALLPRISIVMYDDVIPGVFASLMWLTVMPAMPGWDTSYTVAGLLGFCVLTGPAAIQAARLRNLRAACAGAAAGLLFLFNPSSVLVAGPWAAYSLWRARLTRDRKLVYGSIFLVLFLLPAGGWVVRNRQQMGSYVVRTNLGMTLYASNNDCAESSMFRDQLSGCYQAHHPNVSLPEAAALVSMGEVQYDRQRTADTKDWVISHPDKFLQLTARRVREFWFPATEALPAGETGFAHNQRARNWLRRQNEIAYAIWVITSLSVPGLILMLRRREPMNAYVLVVLAAYPLMYYVVVSDMRYRYPVLWLSLLPAGYLLRAMCERHGKPAPNNEMK